MISVASVPAQAAHAIFTRYVTMLHICGGARDWIAVVFGGASSNISWTMAVLLALLKYLMVSSGSIFQIIHIGLLCGMARQNRKAFLSFLSSFSLWAFCRLNNKGAAKGSVDLRSDL